jgi:DNA-binding response OmpR family regulator
MDLTGCRVLVVDHEPEALDFVCEALAVTGAKVMQAGSAGEALMTLVGVVPDLVIVDIALEGTNGLAFLERMRELEVAKGGRVPVVTAAEGLLQPDDERRWREAGAQAHLTKPYDRDELLAMVHALSGRQVERRRRPARAVTVERRAEA